MTAEIRPRAIASAGVPPKTATEPPSGRARGEHQVDRGGLPGPVRAEEGDDLARLDAQADAVHGAHRPEALVQVNQFQGGHRPTGAPGEVWIGGGRGSHGVDPARRRPRSPGPPVTTCR
jgi:hypothetical protein